MWDGNTGSQGVSEKNGGESSGSNLGFGVVTAGAFVKLGVCYGIVITDEKVQVVLIDRSTVSDKPNKIQFEK